MCRRETCDAWYKSVREIRQRASVTMYVLHEYMCMYIYVCMNCIYIHTYIYIYLFMCVCICIIYIYDEQVLYMCCIRSALRRRAGEEGTPRVRSQPSSARRQPPRLVCV